MAEFLVSPLEKLLAAPKLSLAELALVEPLTIGFHAVDRGRVTRDDVVAVLGCGAIGLGAVAGAAARGARVIAVDIDDQKLALARKCGAALEVHSGRENLSDRLTELTDGDGPNVVVEAIGLPQTFQAAVNEVCFAGRVVYIGYAKAPVEYETKYFVMKEIDILGSRNASRRDFLDVIRLLESGTFPVEGVISHTTELTGAGEALRAWSERPQDFTKIQVAFG
jgi:threonine dehydrogenase-like Zn-dependent dehydrogenase